MLATDLQGVCDVTERVVVIFQPPPQVDQSAAERRRSAGGHGDQVRRVIGYRLY